jgi:hypothetical protein
MMAFSYVDHVEVYSEPTKHNCTSVVKNKIGDLKLCTDLMLQRPRNPHTTLASYTPSSTCGIPHLTNLNTSRRTVDRIV